MVPPHTTGHTGPYTAVRWIDRLAEYEGWQAERGEGGIGKGDRQSGAVAEPPGTVRAPGGLRGKIPPDAPAGQFGEPGPAVRPLLPGDGAQPPPDPLVNFARARRSLAEAEVSARSGEIARQFLDDLREVFAAGPAR